MQKVIEERGQGFPVAGDYVTQNIENVYRIKKYIRPVPRKGYGGNRKIAEVEYIGDPFDISQEEYAAICAIAHDVNE